MREREHGVACDQGLALRIAVVVGCDHGRSCFER